jgi:hypothetical protein
MGCALPAVFSKTQTYLPPDVIITMLLSHFNCTSSTSRNLHAMSSTHAMSPCKRIPPHLAENREPSHLRVVHGITRDPRIPQTFAQPQAFRLLLIGVCLHGGILLVYTARTRRGRLGLGRGRWFSSISLFLFFD